MPAVELVVGRMLVAATLLSFYVLFPGKLREKDIPIFYASFNYVNSRCVDWSETSIRLGNSDKGHLSGTRRS